MEFIGVTRLYPDEPPVAHFAARADEVYTINGDVDGDDFYGRRAWLRVGALCKPVAREQTWCSPLHGDVVRFRGSALLGVTDCDVHIV